MSADWFAELQELEDWQLYEKAQILALHMQRTRNAGRREAWRQGIEAIINVLVLREVKRAA